ncbi:MAG: sporulation protein YtfJ [Clostridiales bacterium]|nr:sporulation protein YtfJ [Clostridiales bacterium]
MKQNDGKNPVEILMAEAMSKLKSVIDVNTVIGNPITTFDGTTIIPISKVSAGFIAGGGEYNQSKDMKKNCNLDFPFAGGSGTGFSITPVGFLIESNSGIKLINIDDKSAYENVLEIIKNVSEKLVK